MSVLFDSLHTLLLESQKDFCSGLTSDFLGESQMSCSIKPFIHDTVTQKQLKLLPPRRDPDQRNPRALIPSQSKHAKVSTLPPEPSAPAVSLSVHSPGH